MATTKASPTPVLDVPGTVNNKTPYGGQIVLFQPGSESFDELMAEGTVDLKFEDGTTVPAVVKSTAIGALIDLIVQYGTQSIYTYGTAYTGRALLRNLGGGKVVDTTKLYTAITVFVSPPLPTAPTLPTS